jgi:hypothetical protein
MYIDCYALPQTFANQISKESTMFAESRPNTNLLNFHDSSRMSKRLLMLFYVGVIFGFSSIE